MNIIVLLVHIIKIIYPSINRIHQSMAKKARSTFWVRTPESSRV